MTWTWKMICKEGIRPRIQKGTVVVLPEKCVCACPGEDCTQILFIVNNDFETTGERVTNLSKPIECPNCGEFTIEDGQTKWLTPQQKA